MELAQKLGVYAVYNNTTIRCLTAWQPVKVVAHGAGNMIELSFASNESRRCDHSPALESAVQRADC